MTGTQRVPLGRSSRRGRGASSSVSLPPICSRSAQELVRRPRAKLPSLAHRSPLTRRSANTSTNALHRPSARPRRRGGWCSLAMTPGPRCSRRGCRERRSHRTPQHTRGTPRRDRRDARVPVGSLQNFFSSASAIHVLAGIQAPTSLPALGTSFFPFPATSAQVAVGLYALSMPRVALSQVDQ
jgi:hypothetical protein